MSDLRKMLVKLKHRGNRQDVKRFNSKIALGYTDMEREHDDSLSSYLNNGSTCIVMDGSLFNEEICNNEDCQFVVDLFEKEGKISVDQLDGAFAFALTDGHSLFVARDPYGIKPLYYGRKNDSTYFASEIKELAEVTKDINIFPPGHYYSSQQGFKRYHDPNNQLELEELNNKEEAASVLKELMIEAVKKRVFPGYKVGILLSGGLDSSIVSAAAKHAFNKVETFAVGLKGSPDLVAARKVASHLGAEHHECIYTEKEIMEVLPEVIYFLESYDAPLVESAIANYFVSKMAAETGCDSVLCGEGADELFAGYHYIKNFESEEAIEKELESIISIGHSMGFQRVDRMNAAHGLESQMPFMDQEIVEFANATPLRWKLHGKDGEDKMEKWILRKAFDGELPQEVVWRCKAQFSHGTGSNNMMEEISDRLISEREYQQAKKEAPDAVIRTKEEYLYYKIFKEFFPYDSAAEAVAHWSDLDGEK